MVTKNTKTEGEKKGRVKVDKLKVNKETVKDLSDKDVKDVKGGGFIMRDTVIVRPPGR